MLSSLSRWVLERQVRVYDYNDYQNVWEKHSVYLSEIKSLDNDYLAHQFATYRLYPSDSQHWGLEHIDNKVICTHREWDLRL